ncbi:MAG: type VI secretion system baseplate subunit TssE [Rhodospirillales bacterium]|nr:type VI secretion system baseplate subunit TssE [Rhodospirillales bacterium]
MSGRGSTEGGRGGFGRAEAGRSVSLRAQLPLLDRLIDTAPDQPNDPPLSAGEAMALLRRAVRRDLEALLNARRRFRSVPAGLAALRTSPLSFGIPDCTAGTFVDPRERERLRREIEETIRRFEPRFAEVKVTLLTPKDSLEATLRLRIEALLHAEPAPEPVAFDTEVETASAEVVVRERSNV